MELEFDTVIHEEVLNSFEVEKVIPPQSLAFPYWTIYYPVKGGRQRVRFLKSIRIDDLSIVDDVVDEGGEEVVQQDQMPGVLSEYRSITGGDDEFEVLPSLQRVHSGQVSEAGGQSGDDDSDS